MCIDANQKVVFFTPKGKALFGAPPAPLPRPKRRKMSPQLRKLGPATGNERKQETPERAYTVRPRYKHDRDIPWAVEARVWDALDSG